MNRKLREEFKNKEYAHGYMETFCVDRIASQIHTLRKQRDLSQEELSRLSGIAQERISKLESGDFDSITMKTLNKLSRAFDVNLSIKFEPFAQAITDVIGLNEQILQVTSRHDNLIIMPYLVQLKTSSSGYATPKPSIARVSETKGVTGQFANFLKVKEKLSPPVFAGVESNEIDNRFDNRLIA